jgi:hypothetical protein
MTRRTRLTLAALLDLGAAALPPDRCGGDGKARRLRVARPDANLDALVTGRLACGLALPDGTAYIADLTRQQPPLAKIRSGFLLRPSRL